MSPAVTRKHFIAGATCPVCSEQDRIQIWGEDSMLRREYATCGYADTLNAQGQSVPEELDTQVSQNALKSANPKVQSVQFFPNPRLKKKPDT